ncbi:MAG: DUF1640 domain-containing protein [Methylococcaceae bacterium]|nr:MAG: DUF1640 domain-containing protein [Methylococcaceae bacterium]
MAAITFDTLKFANTLKDAGVPDKQAEAEAKALSEVLEVNLKDLTTKDDLKLLEANLKRDIAETKAELIRWVVGVGMLQITLIAALVLRLAPHG